MPGTIAPTLRAHWFDGRSSRARPALVRLLPAAGGTALALQALDGAQEQLRLAPREIGWPERWSTRKPPPRLVVDLSAHGSLQIDNPAAWQAALAAAGHRTGLAERMQTQWPMLLAMLLLAVLGVAAFYRWGTPWAAAQLTRHIPLNWELALSAQALQQLDDGPLKPSHLPPARQAELRAGFEQLASAIGPGLQRYPGYQPRLRLEFRSGMPANAFALPGGTIVMTDALAELARATPGTGQPALLGVLAHEIGHVQLRHTTRMVVEQGVLNVGLGLALGDVSTLVSSGASLLTGLAYQRGHEVAADCYAIALLGRLGLPTAPMADLLVGIEHDALARIGGKASAPQAAAPAPRRAPGVDWLSTHPDTLGRAERLKAGTAAGDCRRLASS